MLIWKKSDILLFKCDQQNSNKKDSFLKQEYVKKEIIQCGQERLDNSFSLSGFQSDFIENIIEIENPGHQQSNKQQAIKPKDNQNSKNVNSTSKHFGMYSKIEYNSDDSEQNFKNQLSKKKILKIERKSKERQKRSKYYERMAIKDSLQSEGEENNELYVQSRDILINGKNFETFGIRNKFINESHWLLGDSKLCIKQRQEKAINFLESFLNIKEKIPNNHNLKRIELLNVCSFAIQTSQIHKEIQQYLMNYQIQNLDTSQQGSLPVQRNIFASNQIDKSSNENSKSFILNKPNNSSENQRKYESNIQNNNQFHQQLPPTSQFIKLEAQNYSIRQEEPINAQELLNLAQIYYSKQLQSTSQSQQIEDQNVSGKLEYQNLNKKCIISQSQLVDNPKSSKKTKNNNRFQKLHEYNFDCPPEDSREIDQEQNFQKFNQENQKEIQQKKTEQQSQILFERDEVEEEQFRINQLNFKQLQNQNSNCEEKQQSISKNSEITKKENALNLDQKLQKKNSKNETNQLNNQAYYSSVINQMFSLSFKNQIIEDEFDFNNIKTSKSIYSNSDPSKKQFGIEVMVVNSDEDEIQIERIKRNYGKFHNFNKLFMYNVVKMFSEYNLDNLGVPNMIIQEIINIVNKIKISARRRNNSNKEVQYDYFSIAHYNLLFYLIKNSNTNIIKNQFEYIHFYKKCFKINIQSNSTQSLTVTYANIIKKFCFLIYMNSIQRSYKLASQAQQKTPRQEYILKATEGIQSLHQGNLVRRF
ncbi:hypothetical protein TTHERM_00681860 (macronuclear) [Tetrahymena thermophila SB210]|uniref:Uncharacterized protein n=1 Tax=Tetrahymena thermophila (strain SB210) TaxID=312017 RepID=I7MJQ1_TETTS|nr:hypothetical protein TTHERM_00681860 [Tetrahymena thermophila SB210]EAS07079.4 hypothetical protein TTHERM_00681860 [Tetrahymena thermophila SB210]|eukprot:XP_001027321.4 hypothetical protein TTHERM_00681860 [Tetrahymena thermophila SB210]